MGFFTDLFKEKVDWSEEELMALFAYMTAISAADGKIDADETKVMSEMLMGLPSNSPWSMAKLERLMKKGLAIGPDQHLKVLKSMHSRKKDIALGSLGLVAAADSNVDEKEAAFWNGVRIALGRPKKYRK